MDNDIKKYNKYKKLFLISTFSGVCGLYIIYKTDAPVARYIAYSLFAVWAIFAAYVRILILKDKKDLKK